MGCGSQIFYVLAAQQNNGVSSCTTVWIEPSPARLQRPVDSSSHPRRGLGLCGREDLCTHVLVALWVHGQHQEQGTSSSRLVVAGTSFPLCEINTFTSESMQYNLLITLLLVLV